MKRNDLKKIIKECICEMDLNEESNPFIVKVVEIISKYGTKEYGKEEIYEEESFKTKKEAQKFIRKMIKKYNLKKHAGHIVNYKDSKELETNF